MVLGRKKPVLVRKKTVLVRKNRVLVRRYKVLGDRARVCASRAWPGSCRERVRQDGADISVNAFTEFPLQSNHGAISKRAVEGGGIQTAGGCVPGLGFHRCGCAIPGGVGPVS